MGRIGSHLDWIGTFSVMMHSVSKEWMPLPKCVCIGVSRISNRGATWSGGANFGRKNESDERLILSRGADTLMMEERWWW